jgi:hypothetical protein
MNTVRIHAVVDQEHYVLWLTIAQHVNVHLDMLEILMSAAP